MTAEELRKLDLEVAREVMGWPDIGADEPFRWYYKFGGVVVSGRAAQFPFEGAIPVDWNPASNIADAWQVVEKMRADDRHPKIGPAYRGWWVDLSNPILSETGETAPIAICRASLAVVRAMSASPPLPSPGRQ